MAAKMLQLFRTNMVCEPEIYRMLLNIFRSHVKVDTLLTMCLLTTKGSMLLCRAHSLSTPSHFHPHPTPPSGDRDTAVKFGSDPVSPEGPSVNYLLNNFHFFNSNVFVL